MLLTTFVAVIACVVAGCNGFGWDEKTALDDYVNAQDGLFSWTELTSYRLENDSCTVYILNMTSHRYVDESFSSRSIWWHFMGVAIPDTMTKDFGYLFIDGMENGDNNDASPPLPDSPYVSLARRVANEAGYIGAFLLQVPNQGVVFANDPAQESRREDRFISWTWKTYIDKTDPHYKDPRIIARMPMTKAGVLGLDAVQELVAEKTGHFVDEFCVGGASKRGWTAWSVAATDRRVVAITPMVMSLLNLEDTFQSHFRNLGGWTFAFFDYYEQNLTANFYADDVINWEDGLWNYEDMFRYKERLELIPKLLISATGDEIFLLTDHHNWWDELGGPKWLLMQQNADHTLQPWFYQIGTTVIAWMRLLLEDTLPPVPTMIWLRGSDANGGRILMSVDTIPDTITAWTAHTWRNDTSKDYRLLIGTPPFIHPIVWQTTDVTNLGGGMYEVDIANDLPGFGGIFIDCMWNRLTGSNLHLTTEVHVTPDVYPHPGCTGQDCYGTLV